MRDATTTGPRDIRADAVTATQVPPSRMRQRAASWLRSSYRDNLHDFLRTLIPAGSRVLHVGCGNGSLLAALEPATGLGVDGSAIAVAAARSGHPNLEFLHADVDHVAGIGSFDYVVVGDVLGRLDDVWSFLRGLRDCVNPQGSLVLTYYNFAWEPALELAERLRLKTHVPGQNWLPVGDLVNLLELAGFDAVASGYVDPVPVGPRSVVRPLNRLLSHLPPVRRLGITSYAVARHAAPSPAPDDGRTCSVVIPARNERGNIRPAIQRIPALGAHLEIVFVEGHSTDGTADEIRTVIAEHSELDIKLLDQGPAKGKGDAVRKGMAAAGGDVLIILDADLTVPPEDLPKFWCALLEGKGEFINGTRMVYPMEQQAMRLANLGANRVFGRAFSWILGQRVTDTLCGTKALWADDYRRISENRAIFGDFDPFGDFDLLFGAAHLGLRIREVPIRYRQRTYGTTQISRWRHGVLLLGMTVRGARMLRFTYRARPSARTAPDRPPTIAAGSQVVTGPPMDSQAARR